MKQFKQLVKELPAKKVVFAFGRYQPPTTGHGLLVAAVKRVAEKQGADHVIYASRSQDKKQNPLPVERKVYYLKRMFPGTNFVPANENVRTFIEAIKELNKKYKHLVMVAGSDRVPEYKKLLDKYNGKDFNYDTIEVVSAGERDPDADNASGMSGTKMRDAAKKGDFNLFKKGLPSTLTTQDAKRLMNEIREGMGIEAIREEISFETNELREAYHAGKIFHVGEKVEDENGIYEILDRGTNYLTVVNESGETSKKWIHMVKSFKQMVEDIQPGPAPKEIRFKGYTSKNLHHSADATKAFQSSIERMENGLTKTNDPVALLNALKHTDEYMKLNDLHLETGEALDAKELQSWRHAHAKAKESLERIGEFLHHMDYWHMHEHEIQDLEAKYYPGTVGNEFADSFTPEGSLLEMKFTSADKIKVARIIANTLGVADVEKKGSAEQLVNDGLRKVRNKPMRPEYIDVLHKMLATAKEAGIEYDEKLVPQKVSEGTKQPNGTDKVGDASQVNEISKDTLKSYIPKAMGNKSAADFQRGVKMAQGSGGEEELRKKSEKRSEGIHKAIKKLTREELGLDEAVQVSHERYIRSHSKPARGKGQWAFTHKRMGDVDYHNDSEFHKANGSFEDAKKSAKLWAQKHGHSTAYVMEEVQLDESSVEFRIDHRDKVKGDHKPTFAAHDAKVSDTTDKATYVTVPSHKANSFKSAMKSKHGVNVELSEEVQIEEGKMGELHATISKHLDKHISDFKSGHTGMDQFGSKVLAAHKSVAKEHGLEHKHAAKFVNDYVDSKLNEELEEGVKSKLAAAMLAATVAGHSVPAHSFVGMPVPPNPKVKKVAVKQPDGSVILKTAPKQVKKEEAELDEVSFHTLDKAWHGRYQQALAAKHGSPEHQKAHKSMGKIGDVMKKRTSDKLMHMAKHDPEAYKKSAQQVADDNKKRGWSNEQTEVISDLLEEIATAAMMGKETEHLKKKLSQLRHDPKENESDIDAQATGAAPESKIGKSVTAPHENDTVRRMKIRQMSEEVEELEEDQATAEYKIKKFVGPDGKTHERKIRPHKVTFAASKRNAEPEVDEPGEDMKKEGFDPFFNDGTQTADSMQTTQTVADLKEKKKKKVVKEEDEHEDEHDNVSTESDLDDMANEIKDLEDVIDVYDDSELAIIDDEGEEVDKLHEEVINEVLSRMERIKAKVRFAQTKSKRERKVKIALRSRSSSTTLNTRARKLAVKLMKQRIARKPLNKLSIAEKERLEKIVQKRKAVVGRLAMKLVPRIRKIETQRLTHHKYTK